MQQIFNLNTCCYKCCYFCEQYTIINMELANDKYSHAICILCIFSGFVIFMLLKDQYHLKHPLPVKVPTSFIRKGLSEEKASLSLLSEHAPLRRVRRRSPRSCPKPTKPQKGNAKLRNSGRMVSYTCRKKFQLVGSKLATCKMGSWSSPPPMCVRKGCLKPQHMDPKLHWGFSYDEAVISFTCAYGYQLVGHRVIYCNGKKWNRLPPTCQLPVETTYQEEEIVDPITTIETTLFEETVMTKMDTKRITTLKHVTIPTMSTTRITVSTTTTARATTTLGSSSKMPGSTQGMPTTIVIDTQQVPSTPGFTTLPTTDTASRLPELPENNMTTIQEDHDYELPDADNNNDTGSVFNDTNCVILGFCDDNVNDTVHNGPQSNATSVAHSLETSSARTVANISNDDDAEETTTHGISATREKITDQPTTFSQRANADKSIKIPISPEPGHKTKTDSSVTKDMMETIEVTTTESSYGIAALESTAASVDNVVFVVMVASIVFVSLLIVAVAAAIGKFLYSKKSVNYTEGASEEFVAVPNEDIKDISEITKC